MTILVAGAGAMADAAASMRRTQNRMNHYFSQRRARRAARRGPRLPSEFEGDGPRTNFACASLCLNCGFFTEPVLGHVDDDFQCPGCGASEWVDLEHHAHAEMLRESGQDARLRPNKTVRNILLFVTLIVISALFVGDKMWLAAAFPICFAVLAVLWGKVDWISSKIGKNGRAPELRWHAPFVFQPTDPVVIDGVSTVDGAETVKSPLTNEDCLAYAIHVRFDIDGDARPPQWVLLEQKSAELTLDGEPVGEVLLNFTPEPVNIEIDGTFLRQRGLFASDGEFEFFQTVIRAGDEVTIMRHENGLIAG